MSKPKPARRPEGLLDHVQLIRERTQMDLKETLPASPLEYKVDESITYPAGAGGRAKGVIKALDEDGQLATIETQAGRIVRRRVAGLRKVEG